jgi:hypothetical protein
MLQITNRVHNKLQGGGASDGISAGGGAADASESPQATKADFSWFLKLD